MTKKKRPEDILKRGHPTKYRKKYCQGVIEHMKGGLSFESYGAVIGVNRDTLYNWTTLFPEFSDAKRQATDHCLLFYEKIGVMGMTGKIKNFSAPSWIFSMKARFKWAESHEREEEDDDDLDEALAELDKEAADGQP